MEALHLTSGSHDGNGTAGGTWSMAPADPTDASPYSDGTGSIAWPMGPTSGNHNRNGGGSTRRTPKGGWLADGTQLDPTTVARLACDCDLHRILRNSESAILDYGRAARTAPTNLFNALVARDRTCRFPGCNRPAHWCEAHHVRWWEHGGTTSLQNTILLCSRHHHLIHNPGWQAKIEPDATLQITRPDGRTYISRPPGQPPDLFSQPAA